MAATIAESASLPSAGLAARTAAWSIDALLVGVPTLLLCWMKISYARTALASAWKALQQALPARLGNVSLGAGDPASAAAQLLADPQLLALTARFEAALHGLLLPPLLVFVLLAALYWISCEASSWQATLGKRALALRSTDLHGRPLTVAQAAARHFAGTLSWLTLNLGHLLAALPPDKRALHDRIAGTRVVHADGVTRVPAWARAWLWLLLLGAVVLPAWWLLRQFAQHLSMLQASI